MKLANMIASSLHEDWRKTRLQKDGSFEPRWKIVKDQKFLEGLDKENLPKNFRVNEEGKVEIDIANSTYEELSPDWQAENKAAGEVVAEIIESGESLTYDEIGEKIHSAWLERNSWAKDDPILSKPFAELPIDQQNKDIAQYNIGLAAVQASEKDNKQENSDIESE